MALKQAVTFGRGLRRAYQPRPAPRLFPGSSGAWAEGLGDLLALAGQAACPPDIAPILWCRHLAADPTTNTHRKPMLLLRLSAALLLRFDDSRFRDSLLFQEPPRNTRLRVRPPSHSQHDGRLTVRLKFFRPRFARKGKRVKR